MGSRKPKTPKRSSAPTRWQAARTAFVVLLTLGLAVGLLLGLSQLGNEARRRIGPHDRYQVRFADIECNTPPGTTRDTFLAEVRYVGNFPETFNLMSEADLGQLRAAFAMHPWVAAVEAVDVEAPARVRVRLQFRAPALTVRVEGGGSRLVDAAGVLLPVAEPPKELPELMTPVPPPQSGAGQVWANETVRRALELAASYPVRRLDRLAKGWRLTQQDGKTLMVER